MQASLIINELNNTTFKTDIINQLIQLYGTESLVHQRQRYIKALDTFLAAYGDLEAELYSAPGRTEIGGNHTDHQHGQVLAASINLDAIAVAGKTDDHVINILSEGYDMLTIDTSNLDFNPEEQGTTLSLIKGILHAMTERGYAIGGFNAYITSDVLIGAGLSSSAAFEAVVGTIISGLYNDLSIPPVDIAIIGQFAENKYFGKPCGLMDQMACCVGGFVHMDFADINHPKVQKLEHSMEQSGYTLCIVDTKGSHCDLTDEYAAIPAEMCQVANFFGRQYLNEVDEHEFFNAIPSLAASLNHRAVLRGMHFFKENNRVVREMEALCRHDFAAFLALVKESGHSSFCYLQNIYSNKEIDNQPVSIALAASEHVLVGHGVSRIHGGGFAGTIQAFVKKEALHQYCTYMNSIFDEGACHVLSIRDFGGIRII